MVILGVGNILLEDFENLTCGEILLASFFGFTRELLAELDQFYETPKWRAHQMGASERKC